MPRALRGVAGAGLSSPARRVAKATTPTAKVHTPSTAAVDTDHTKLSAARNLYVIRSDKQLGTAQRRLWLLGRGAQCAYQKCSLVAGVRQIGTTTGITVVIVITTIGIGATGGATGTTTIGIPGTDR